jgi:hypothetical protein
MFKITRSCLFLAVGAALLPVAAQAAEIVPVPMTHEAWTGLNKTQKIQYADATIQGLRRNPVMAQCQALEPLKLADMIDARTEKGTALIMTIAGIVYEICPVN